MNTKNLLLLLITLNFSTTLFSQVTTQQTVYNYQIAYCVGSQNSTAWIGQDVVVMIEAETPADRDPVIMAQVIGLFEDVIAKYEELTGLTNLPMASQYNGKPVIEVVLDNCGAGGLASHGVLGMSTGTYFLNEFYNLLANGQVAMPQVFLYELNRNFWAPSFNNKFDWAMDNQSQNWGWWTVGMNNAQAYIIPQSLGIDLYYFGNDINYWENRMVGELNDYMNDTQYDFDYGWRQALMPWHNTESINDLMSGLLIYSYNNFGGENWVKGFYQYIQDASIPNRPNVFAYQECRDNVYKIWSLAAQQDLISFFENDLRWVISQATKDCVASELACAPMDLTFNFDATPQQTSWQILDVGGTPVASGGGYNASDMSAAEAICLPDGCYELVVSDSANNGMCPFRAIASSSGTFITPGTLITSGSLVATLGTVVTPGLCGNYALNDANGNPIANGGGSFGASDTNSFCISGGVPQSLVNDEANYARQIQNSTGVTSFHLYPTPTNDLLNIQFDGSTANTIQLNIIDMTGKIIHTESRAISDSNIQFDVNNLNSGIYFVQMTSDKTIITEKFIKK